MTILRDWTTGNRVGLAVLGLTIICMLTAGFRAARLEPLPDGPDEGSRRFAYPTSVSRAHPRTPAILAAVRANPMRLDRRRAEGRYGQEPIDEEAEPQVREPVPAFRVVGVVLRRRGPDLAAIASDGTPPQLVRRGDRIHGFVLRRIGADSVFLARPDTTIGLAAPGRRFAGGTD